uniref:Transposase n=1 Tax=Ascaris lumbricoides TaxID=6252 RepID=A0A0M3HPR8_ASCLU
MFVRQLASSYKYGCKQERQGPVSSSISRIIHYMNNRYGERQYQSNKVDLQIERRYDVASSEISRSWHSQPQAQLYTHHLLRHGVFSLYSEDND